MCVALPFLRREAQIHPSSSLWRRNPPAKCVVFTELLSTSRDVSVGAHAVCSIWSKHLRVGAEIAQLFGVDPPLRVSRARFRKVVSCRGSSFVDVDEGIGVQGTYMR